MARPRPYLNVMEHDPRTLLSELSTITYLDVHTTNVVHCSLTAKRFYSLYLLDAFSMRSVRRHVAAIYNAISPYLMTVTRGSHMLYIICFMDERVVS